MDSESLRVEISMRIPLVTASTDMGEASDGGAAHPLWSELETDTRGMAFLNDFAENTVCCVGSRQLIGTGGGWQSTASEL